MNSFLVCPTGSDTGQKGATKAWKFTRRTHQSLLPSYGPQPVCAVWPLTPDVNNVFHPLNYPLWPLAMDAMSWSQQICSSANIWSGQTGWQLQWAAFKCKRVSLVSNTEMTHEIVDPLLWRSTLSILSRSSWRRLALTSRKLICLLNFKLRLNECQRVWDCATSALTLPLLCLIKNNNNKKTNRSLQAHLLTRLALASIKRKQMNH